MLQGEFPDRLAVERALAGEHLHVNHGQAVLVAVLGDPRTEGLRGGVLGRDPRQDAGGTLPLQVTGQAEIRNLDVIANDEQIPGFHVHVHDIVRVGQVVQALGAVGHVAKEFFPGDARQPGGSGFVQHVVEALLGQFHDHHHLALDNVDPFDRKHEGMADFLDSLDGVKFLTSPAVAGGRRVEAAEDKLDGLEDLPGGLAKPDLPETSGSQRADQAVTGNRFLVSFADETHGANTP